MQNNFRFSNFTYEQFGYPETSKNYLKSFSDFYSDLNLEILYQKEVKSIRLDTVLFAISTFQPFPHDKDESVGLEAAGGTFPAVGPKKIVVTSTPGG